MEESRVEINRPRAATTTTILEAVLSLSSFAIAIAILFADAWGPQWQIAARASAVTWGYISILVLLRLAGQTVWYHTATLYGIQWLTTTIFFRSTILHSRSNMSRSFEIVTFSLTSALMIITITTRKGNKTMFLQHEKRIEPSQEPLASLLSIVTFSWMDPLIWDGYKSPLEIGRVWNVLPKERSKVLLERYRLFKKTGQLTIHLIKFFSPDLLFQQIWAFIAAVFVFIPTLLLKAILEYVEDPLSVSRSTAWLYVVLLLVAGLISGAADGQALWRGRKICIQLRAVMVGEIYAKTLRRKAASAGDTEMSSSEKGHKRSFLDRLLGRNKKPAATQSKDSTKDKDKDKGDTQVNSGTIINLMSVDAFKVAEISAYWHFLLPTVPVQLVVAIFLLYRIMGWSALAGIAVMFGVLPLNVYFSNQFSAVQEQIMSATDARIHATNEVLQNVRIIKYFAWEDRFARNIDEKRWVEIKALRYRFVLWTVASIVWFGVPMVITASSFFLYTMVEKKPLYPSVAFTSLALFQLLRYPLDRLADMAAHVLESKVSIDRVEKFLNEEETGKYEQLAHVGKSGNEKIGIVNANFSWGSKDEGTNVENPAFRLINIDIDFKLGGLNVIAGPTGSGKTSVLMALLGEMTLLDGSVHLPGGYDRLSLKPGDDGLTDSVAYCAQQAWLVNDTIKQNILFASPYDEQRYQSVLSACALERDLEVFENGDETLVGEKGIVVSGGQKQRISLARALYCNARYVLLDDCLSAVDSHTAQHIFDHCINGPLMLHRTCILVTHNVALCVPEAKFVVVMNNGKIQIKGTPEKVIASGALGEDMQKSAGLSRPGTKAHSRATSVKDFEEDDRDKLKTDTAVPGDKKVREEVKDANTRTEEKATGSVDWQVVRLYLAAMGPWWFWIAILLGFSLENLSNAATNIWIRQWANSYHYESPQFAAQGMTFSSQSNNTADTVFWAPFKRIFPYASSSEASALSGGDDVSDGYYLGVYSVLSVLYMVICFVRLGWTFHGAIVASKKIHTMLLSAVLRAKFKFFDTTPLGQINNRFSKDLEAVDQEIAPVAAGVLQSLFQLVTIIILISVITPGFLIAGFFLTALYTGIGALYIRASRDLKRIESTLRSPLYQQFGETLSGVTTIRAYGDEKRFTTDNSQRVDTHNRPFIFLWGANRWLALRVDWAGALVSFFAATFVIINIGHVDAGAAGLSLTYALGFNENILWLVRLYAENEQNMNHMERIKKFLDVEQEAPAQIPETKPNASWPAEGAVEFVNYQTRYRPDLEPVLRNLSFKIKAQEKVGIVGRTGAGKSSLALAMFRGLEADQGKIVIDGVDIGTIGLQDLRENLTIVPQDPTLFTGTIRSNLDPFELFTDEEVFTALRRVHLIGPDSVISSHSSVIEDEEVDPLSRMRTNDSTVRDTTLPPSTADISAPAPTVMRRASISVPDELVLPAPAEISKTLTNTRENANVFHNLSSPVAESGTNLSQGQRQLLCLARALLKSPRVLLMDEATASIDYATDAKIQTTLRELKGSTIVTIAHRLQTIVDYDKVLVLEKGEVAEFDTPWDLIKKEDGIFRGMCEKSGDFEILLEMAEKARKSRQLVDV